MARTKRRSARTIAMILGLTAAVPAAAQLRAGAGRADVSLTPAMLPLDGFKTIHDPLAARVLLLDEGGTRAAIVVVDQTSLGTDVVEAIRDLVAQVDGTPPPAVLVVASHTFSAPHLFTADHLPPGATMSREEAGRASAYRAAVLTAVRQAALAASRWLAPATVGYGDGVADVNINRNMPMADGWWLGANPAGPSDKTLGLVRVDDVSGRPIAMLVDYAVQSSVMDHSVVAGGEGVTADLGGAAVRHVERQYGDGSVALFLTGAAGDQAPAYASREFLYDKDGRLDVVDQGDAGYRLVDLQGRRLGAAAVRVGQAIKPAAAPTPLLVSRGIVPLKAQERPRDLREIKPTRRYSFEPGGTTEAPFVVLQLGDLAIVGVQAELSAVTGKAIRERSPFPHTLVVTMVDGAAKYMPDAAAYRDITYEAMNSPYAAGSAERFADGIVDRLRSLRLAGGQ